MCLLLSPLSGFTPFPWGIQQEEASQGLRQPWSCTPTSLWQQRCLHHNLKHGAAAHTSRWHLLSPSPAAGATALRPFFMGNQTLQAVRRPAWPS